MRLHGWLSQLRKRKAEVSINYSGLDYDQAILKVSLAMQTNIRSLSGSINTLSDESDVSDQDASVFSRHHYSSHYFRIKKQVSKKISLSGDDLDSELGLRKSIKAHWKKKLLEKDKASGHVDLDPMPAYEVDLFSKFPESLSNQEIEGLTKDVGSGVVGCVGHRKRLTPEEIKDQQEAFRLERSANGLVHLNIREDKALEKLENARFTHKAKARARHGLDFQIGIQDVRVKSGIKNNVRYENVLSARGKRSKITKFSKASVNRMKLLLRNIDPALINSILTLTYPEDYPTDGRETKRHLDLMKRWLKRHGVARGFWFYEFQKRGAPHFHAFISSFPRGGVDAISRAWYQIVNSGDEKHLAWHNGQLSGRKCLEVMRSPMAASVYATKYASKMNQKEVPEGFENVGRFWGQWGNFRPVWKWVQASGDHAISTARDAILEFRSAWSNPESLERFDKRPYLSCTMWGGAKVLDDLLIKHGFTPF